MNLNEFGFDFKDKYEVNGKPKLCWSCIKKYETGFMVNSRLKMRRIFFCKDCLDKSSK
ncbi:MAG: hypothetical protein JW891_11190 [Candidatus Lokiarchaeota archaeon]|nr:hypothetical protein [Candidatus Lokiarchaeota archaeon]